MKNLVYTLDSTADGYVASGIEASMNNVYLEFDTAEDLFSCSVSASTINPVSRSSMPMTVTVGRLPSR